MIRYAFVLLALVALSNGPAYAGGRTLPPHTDLDPDRGMTFGRLSRTSLDSSVLAPFKQSAHPRIMDPSIDPFVSPLKSDRYEPQTGRITGSLTDTMKGMRKTQENSRKSTEKKRQNEERKRQESRTWKAD